VPNFIALSQTVYTRKTLQSFTPFGILAPQGTLGTKFTDLGIDVQQGQTTSVPNFAPSYKLSARCLLQNFVDLVESVTDRPTKQ